MTDNLLFETGEWLLLEDVYGVLLLEQQNPDPVGYIVAEVASPGAIEAVALWGD